MITALYKSTLWFKKPDPYYIFKQIRQILVNINNFGRDYRESTKSLQCSHM